jgi:hypothetical protein
VPAARGHPPWRRTSRGRRARALLPERTDADAPAASYPPLLLLLLLHDRRTQERGVVVHCSGVVLTSVYSTRRSEHDGCMHDLVAVPWCLGRVACCHSSVSRRSGRQMQDHAQDREVLVVIIRFPLGTAEAGVEVPATCQCVQCH